jgi:putative tryptophan/tyrosine transport system substrate-binding protein
MDRRRILTIRAAGRMKMTIGILVLLLMLVLAGSPFASGVSAQKDTKVYRFGWVSLAPTPTQPYPTYEALKARLAEHGYIEGKNITFEPRWLSGNSDRAPEALAEMERSGVDLIFVPSTTMGRISQDVVKKTPLILYSCDPFDHVARLARHGRNVSGVTCMTSELTPKRLELLKEAVPAASRIVFLAEPEDSPSGLKRAQDAAPRLGIKLTPVGFKTRADVPRALDVVAKERPHALFVYPDAISLSARGEIADFALKHQLPTMYAFREFVDAGGLMSYGANSVDMFRLVADQSARVLNGAAPGDVPVIQATRFELVINLKTAKALGLTIPPSLLARADQIIE